ncbi:MAG: hypothetical protein AAGN66_25665 [Acidobacteriota bacterium]
MPHLHSEVSPRAALIRSAALTCVVAVVCVVPAQAESPKGGETDSGYSAPLRASGGPDLFGYRWFDQDEPECNYAFFDISGSGTPLTFTASGTFPADDDGGAAVALPAPVDFYGTLVNQMVVSTNGYISMGATLGTEDGGDFSEDCPLPASPDNAVAFGSRLLPYHNDLAGDGTGGTVFYEYFTGCPRPGEAGVEDCSIVQWDDWGFFNGTVGYDMQVVIYHGSGLFVYQYDDPGAQLDGSSTAIGLQNASAAIALEIGCDTLGAVGDGTALCIYNPNCSEPGCLAVPVVVPTDIPTAGSMGLLAMAVLLSLAGGLLIARRS